MLRPLKFKFYTTLVAVLSVLVVTFATALFSTAGTSRDVVTAASGTSGDGSYGRTILVLDSSGSMAESTAGGKTKIVAARDALRSVISKLPAQAPVGLRVFGATVFSRTDKGACEDTQLVVPPGTGNRSQLLQALNSYKPYGETPIPQALRAAAKDLGTKGPRSIVLISDGESTCQPDACVVARELTDAGFDLRIDVVGLSVKGDARNQLKCIADAGSGTYYDANSAEDIRSNLIRVTERAIRPFYLTGTPIAGGSVDNPTPITVGDWVDTYGAADTAAGQRSYVFTRTKANTAVRVSAFTQGRRGDEGLQVELTNAEGDRCDYTSILRQIDARGVLGAQVTGSSETDCGAPGRYIVTVKRRLGETPTRVGIRVTEEPALVKPVVVKPATIELVAPKVSGKPQPVIGGTSFANAAPLSTGSYVSNIVPGESQLYKIPLQYGQAARVNIRFSPGSSQLLQQEGALLFGTLADVTMFNPMQATLARPEGADLLSAVGQKEPKSFLVATAVVNRAVVDEGGTSGTSDYSVAGNYYLGVSLAREDYTIPFPFTIEVEVVGKAQPAPGYVDGQSWSVQQGLGGSSAEPGSPSTSPTPVENGSSGFEVSKSSTPDDDAESGGVTLWVGVLGVALLVVAGVVLLRRRQGQ